MMDELTTLESRILDALLQGDHPVLTALRAQVPGTRVVHRECSGAGFFTEFVVDQSLERAPVGNVRIADVLATVPTLVRGAGFVLFVEKGYLSMLEGYSYEEPWPERAEIHSVSYLDPQRSALFGALSKACNARTADAE